MHHASILKVYFGDLNQIMFESGTKPKLASMSKEGSNETV